MDPEIESMERKWAEQADKLMNDFDSFWDYFMKNKECACPVDDCKHFDDAVVQILGKRTDKIYKTNIDIGFRIYTDEQKFVR